MGVFNRLNKIGYIHYTDNTIEELDNLSINDPERIMERSMVFKWFRDMNIHSCIQSYHCLGEHKPFGLEIDYMSNNNWINSGRKHNEEFQTHEEAEESAINIIIEIIKNDKNGF